MAVARRAIGSVTGSTTTRDMVHSSAGRLSRGCATSTAAGAITTAAVGIGFLVTGAIAGLALWWGTRSYHQAMV
jgi:hypothetical protein